MPYSPPPELRLKAIACKNLVDIVFATITIEFVLDNGCQHAGVASTPGQQVRLNATGW